MASPSLSAILTFVKKYPITLCGFTLFFMPSVHRLLVYFTPLLLSTAIFIVAMLTWGPSVSSEKSTLRRPGNGKPRLMAEHNEWDFQQELYMDDDDDDDEYEDTEEKGDQTEEADKKDSVSGKASQGLYTQVTTQNFMHTNGTILEVEGEPNSGFKQPEESEPDPDLDMAPCAGGAEAADSGPVCDDAEPEPKLQEREGAAGKDDGGLHERCTCDDEDASAAHEGDIPGKDGDGDDDAGPYQEAHELGHDAHDEMYHDAHDNDKMYHAHDNHGHHHHGLAHVQEIQRLVQVST